MRSSKPARTAYVGRARHSIPASPVRPVPSGGAALSVLLVPLAFIVLTALVGPGALTQAAPQDGGSNQQPPFILKENVHLVIVPVTVKDQHGTLVDDLEQDDFKILEDGRPRPVQYFLNETTPLSAVILIDTGMPAVSLDAVRSGLHTLMDSLAPDDQEALILFDQTIRPTEDLTTHADRVVAAAEKALPRGIGEGASILGGPLGNPPGVNGVPVGQQGAIPASAPRPTARIDDALFAAAQELRTQPAGRRRVVVILSAGVNSSGNQIGHDDVMEALEAAQVTVYAVSFSNGWTLKRADLLARVARDTGGDIVYVERRTGFENAFPELTNEARNSYVLGFPPLAADGRFHQIKVRVRRSGVHWIARNRFLAPPVK